MLVIIFLFMKNTPKDVGILPYGLEEEIQESNEGQRCFSEVTIA
jgi:hypothetical protein